MSVCTRPIYQAVIRGPGLIFVLPFLEKIKKVDTRTQVFEVPPQQILSTDSVTLTVDAVIYYRVFDPVRAACRVLDFNQVKIVSPLKYFFLSANTTDGLTNIKEITEALCRMTFDDI